MCYSQVHYITCSTEVAHSMWLNKEPLQMANVSVRDLRPGVVNIWESAGVRSGQRRHQMSSLSDRECEMMSGSVYSSQPTISLTVRVPFNALNHKEEMWSLTITTLSFWKRLDINKIMNHEIRGIIEHNSSQTVVGSPREIWIDFMLRITPSKTEGIWAPTLLYRVLTQESFNALVKLQ